MARPQSDKRTEIKNPGSLDFRRANEDLEKIIRENIDWLKEMAKK